jgi:hypothetical protein
MNDAWQFLSVGAAVALAEITVVNIMGLHKEFPYFHDGLSSRCPAPVNRGEETFLGGFPVYTMENERYFIYARGDIGDHLQLGYNIIYVGLI